MEEEPELRSAFTASSLLEASSGFQWPLPDFCLERESCLWWSKFWGEGSAGEHGRVSGE